MNIAKMSIVGNSVYLRYDTNDDINNEVKKKQVLGHNMACYTV